MLPPDVVPDPPSVPATSLGFPALSSVVENRPPHDPVELIDSSGCVSVASFPVKVPLESI